jgi:hypothetical protein
MFDSPFMPYDYIVGIIENGIAKAQDFANYIGHQQVMVVDQADEFLPFLHYGGVLPDPNEAHPDDCFPGIFGGIFWIEITGVDLTKNTVEIVVAGENVVMDMDADELAIRIEAT